MPRTCISCFIELASCGSMGSRIVHSLWLIEVDPHRSGSISLRPVVHIYLTMLGPISHTRRNRILLSQRQRCVSGVARDSNAKVPASKVKTEILALRGRINGVLSHVQFHWANEASDEGGRYNHERGRLWT